MLSAQVRNAGGHVVQFDYGDDGLDPLHMEGRGGEPVDFARALQQVKAASPRAGGTGALMPAALSLLPAELTTALAHRLSLRGLVPGSASYSEKFVQDLQAFGQEQVPLCLCMC